MNAISCRGAVRAQNTPFTPNVQTAPVTSTDVGTAGALADFWNVITGSLRRLRPVKKIGAFRELAAATHGVLAVTANPAAHSSAAERGGRSRESVSVCSQRSPAPRKRGPTFSDLSTVLVPRPEKGARPCRW